MKTPHIKNRLISAGVALASLWAAAEQAHAIVGYVNKSLTNGYNFLANPLNAAPNNIITNVLYAPPDGSRVYVWDVTNQVFWPPAIYDAISAKWTTNLDLPPGKGFVMFSPTRWTNTFVGEVLQGSLTNFVAGTNRLSLLGSKVPISGELTSVLGFPRIDGANAYFFNSTSQSYSDGFTCFDGLGWFDPEGVAGTNGPILPVAESFFVQNPRSDTNWVRNFTVGPLVPQLSFAAPSRPPPPEIRQMAVSTGQVTLTIQNPSGAAYNVQFSTDGQNWTTVATDQTGGSWTGPLPAGPRGFFQTSNP